MKRIRTESPHVRLWPELVRGVLKILSGKRKGLSASDLLISTQIYVLEHSSARIRVSPSQSAAKWRDIRLMLVISMTTSPLRAFATLVSNTRLRITLTSQERD